MDTKISRGNKGKEGAEKGDPVQPLASCTGKSL
jgi:hypothetical protein